MSHYLPAVRSRNRREGQWELNILGASWGWQKIYKEKNEIHKTFATVKKRTRKWSEWVRGIKGHYLKRSCHGVGACSLFPDGSAMGGGSSSSRWKSPALGRFRGWGVERCRARVRPAASNMSLRSRLGQVSRLIFWVRLGVKATVTVALSCHCLTGIAQVPRRPSAWCSGCISSLITHVAVRGVFSKTQLPVVGIDGGWGRVWIIKLINLPPQSRLSPYGFCCHPGTVACAKSEA